MGPEVCMPPAFIFLYAMDSDMNVVPANYPTISCCVPFWRGVKESDVKKKNSVEVKVLKT